MKLKWLFVAGAFAASAQIAQARPLYQFDLDAVRHDMQVQVQPELSFVPATADVVMNVTFTNGGSEPVALTNWFIPGEDFDLPMFDVRRYGAPVEYMGPVIKRGVPTAADLVVLQPGESLSVPIDLSGSYDFSAGGDYTIRYSMRSAHLFGAGHAGVAVLRSPAAEISVESRAYFNPHDVLKAKPGTATCSATQQSTIGQALTAAAQMANDAQSYLAKTRPSATPRYTTWFGSFSQAGWDTAHGHFDKIADAFATKIHVADVDCGCKKSYYA